MLIMGLISWWYGPGWKQQFSSFVEHVARMYDYFSIDLLAKSLFSPFKQISAGHVSGPIGVQLRAFADRMLSRVIGAFVRTVTIFVGLIAIFLAVVWNLLLLIMWGLLPLLPILCIFLAIIGWTPWL